MEKIAVKVSTANDQIVVARFLYPGYNKLPLNEHVNALKNESSSWSITIVPLEGNRTMRGSEFSRRA